MGPYTEGQQVTLICDAFGGETVRVSDIITSLQLSARCDEMMCEFSCTAFVVSFLILKQIQNNLEYIRSITILYRDGLKFGP